jgi:Skp family chaperone for outer membrane proteins
MTKTLIGYLGLFSLALTILISCESKTPPSPIVAAEGIAAASGVGHKIGYVNIDTLYEKYTWFKDQKAALTAKVGAAQKTLQQKEETFMRKVQAFQEKAQGGNVPPIELEKEQNRLAAEEQELQKQQARMSQNLEEESIQANEQLLATLELKLKEIRTQIGYDYILGYQRGNPTILLANEDLDVTQKVLELLNANTSTEEKK